MGGKSSSGSVTNSQSTSQGWAPAMDAVSGLMPGLTAAAQAGTQTTGAEQGALNQLQTNAANVTNYAPQAQGLANDMLAGGTGTAANMMNGAYNNLQGTLSPYTQSNYLDPTQTPGMQQMLQTIRDDVGNSVNGQFAGAGRDLSGYNTQTLARGIAQGEAAPLLNQYNQNVSAQQGAAGTLYGAGMGTAQGLQGLTQQDFSNRAGGLDMGVNGVPAANNAGAMGVLNAGTMAQQFPLQNYGAYTGLLGQLAGLGQTTNGSQQTQGWQQASPMQEAMGWTGAFKNVFGGK